MLDHVSPVVIILGFHRVLRGRTQETRVRDVSENRHKSPDSGIFFCPRAGVLGWEAGGGVFGGFGLCLCARAFGSLVFVCARARVCGGPWGLRVCPRIALVGCLGFVCAPPAARVPCGAFGLCHSFVCWGLGQRLESLGRVGVGGY